MKARNQYSDGHDSERLDDVAALEPIEALDVRARTGQLAGELDQLVLRAIARLARRAFAALRRYRLECATVRALSGLSDATLKDIGMHRSEIHRVAAEAATRCERDAEHAPRRGRFATTAYDAVAYPAIDRLAG